MDSIGITMQKKAAELERLAEVLVTGEQLRYVDMKHTTTTTSNDHKPSMLIVILLLLLLLVTTINQVC